MLVPTETKPAVLGAALADLEPAAVVELGFERAGAGKGASIARELHAHDRLASGGRDVLVGRAGARPPRRSGHADF